MQFIVDQNTCINCGACEEVCPEVFECTDDEVLVKLDSVPEDLQEAALGAEDTCPVDAISHS